MSDFLTALFGDAVSDNLRIALFALPSKRAIHFTSVEKAATFARTLNEDVYFGVGLARENFDRRNKVEDIYAIGGLWVDVDVRAPHRDRADIPPAKAAAWELIQSMPLEPSAIIDSGWGLHGYWILKEPWIFDDAGEREQAAATAKGWHGLLCELGARKGWKLENLGDLARIMRMPGTLNRKGAAPVPCTVVELNDRRYNSDEFSLWTAPTSPVVDVEFELASFDDSKLAALQSASKAFCLLWNRQRPDLSSQSEYDLGLADLAVLHGWTDGEIAALIEEHRAMHGESIEKAQRTDYLKRTIGKARTAKGVNLAGLTGGELTPVVVLPTAEPHEVSANAIRTLPELDARYPKLRPAVIEGLLRLGETMNVVAPPKTGKSWLVDDLALSIARGLPWFGFQTTPGKVLIIDNELHPETSIDRFRKVAAARGLFLRDLDGVSIINVRGFLKDLFRLHTFFATIPENQYQVVILDAFYRFQPPGASENDNGNMAQLYNQIDQYAAAMNCSFICIHHSSKGSQAGKDITDVGAGAGAQSRATDTHLIMRRHETEKNIIVMEAVMRSWPPFDAPKCLTWEFPLWSVTDAVASVEPEKVIWTAEHFARTFLTNAPTGKALIFEAAELNGLTESKAKKLLARAVEMRLAIEIDGKFLTAPGAERG